MDPPTDSSQRMKVRRVADLHDIAFVNSQKRPCGFRQGDLVVAQYVALDLQERRMNVPAAGRDKDLRPRGEAFGAADVAVGSHDDEHIVLSMQPEPSGTERRKRRFRFGNPLHRSKPSP